LNCNYRRTRDEEENSTPVVLEENVEFVGTGFEEGTSAPVTERMTELAKVSVQAAEGQYQII